MIDLGFYLIVFVACAELFLLLRQNDRIEELEARLEMAEAYRREEAWP